MSKDNLSSLYNGLLKKGYSANDIGDEATFRSKMADKQNRKKLYDYVSSRGDFRIGDYDSYEKRLSSDRIELMPEPQLEEALEVEELHLPVSVINENKSKEILPTLQRKSLREQVANIQGMQVVIPDEFEMANKFSQEPLQFDVNRNLQTAKAKGELDTILKQDEEKSIDSMFITKPIKDASDIYTNYTERFALTERGKELSAELADISREVQEKYAQRFLNSPEYKELAGKYQGEELNRKATEAFQRTYSTKIEEEIKPYMKVYQDEAFSRYKGNIDRDLQQYAEKQRQETKDKVAADVSRLNESVTTQMQGIHRSLQGKSGTGNNAFNALMGSASYNVMTADERKAKTELEVAQGLLEESQNIIDEARKKGKTNFVAGVGRGFADTAFDPETWSFGLADLREGKLLLDALNKFDEGKQLTETEQTLMDAAVANMATNAYYYSDLGRGYKAGMTSGQSVPFMLEFAINPVSASGSAVAKSILKYGMKKFGKDAAKKGVSKFVARLTGDALAAAGMTATSSAARVAAGMLDREIGDIQLDQSAEYAGRKNKQEAGKALAKSFASTFLENQSEMVFNAFKGLGPKIWGNVEKHIPGGVPALMDNAFLGKAGQIYRKIKTNPVLVEAAKRTQFHGIGEEYLEEVYNNFANIPLGEMTLEEATDLDNNIDTFLGLAPTSVAFGMLGLGGLANEKYQHRKRLKAVLGNLSRLEREQLDELERLAENGSNEDIKEFLKQTISADNLTPEEKKAEIAYAYQLAVGNAIDDVEAEQTKEVDENYTAATQEGIAIYQQHDPVVMRQTVLRNEVARDRLLQAGITQEEVEALDKTPVSDRHQYLSALPEEAREAAEEYLQTLDRVNALNEALDVAHEEEVNQARTILDEVVLPDKTVKVVSLGKYATGTSQFGVVTSGIDENGNRTQSNGALMVYPVEMENGKPIFSSIDTQNPMAVIPDTYSEQMTFTPDEAFSGMLKAYNDDASILEGTPIVPGASFPIMLDDGTMQNVVVSAIDGTGRIAVVLPDGTPTYMDETDLTARKRNAEIAPIMQEYADREMIQQEAVQEAATTGYSQEVKNLQPHAGESIVVNGRNAIIQGVSPDGLNVNYLDESGEIVGVGQVPVEAYYDYKQSQFNQPTQTEKAEEVNQPAGTENLIQSENNETENAEVQISEFPRDENGEPLFEQMQPEQTVSLLTSMLEEDAPVFVAQKLSEAEKAAKKATEKSPKKTSFVERVKELEEIKQEKITTAQAVSYWKNIASLLSPNTVSSVSQKPQQETPSTSSIQEQAAQEMQANQERLAEMSAEEQRMAQEKVQQNINKGKYEKAGNVRKRVRYGQEDTELGEPNTAYEHVLREIATGRVSFRWADMGATKGLGSHLGLSGSEADRRKFIWALSGEGLAPEVAAEAIHADMPSYLQGTVTDQDVFNMIIDAFGEYATPSKMFDAAKRLHGVDIEETMPGYKEDAERQALEWEAAQNKMSVEDWTAFLDIVEEELTYSLRTISNEDLNTIFEEIYNEYESRGNEIESAESTEQSANSERGNEIQSEQQADNERASKELSEQGRTTETGEQGSGILPQQLKVDEIKNAFNYFTGSIKDLIKATKEAGSRLIKKIVSPVNPQLIEELASKGILIDESYKHTIDNNAINHAINRHGSEKERLSGQIPITEKDIENISDVIENYDSIETGKNKRGQDNIIYSKKYPDGITIYIEEVRTGRKELAMASIRKQKNGELTDANSQATQISDLSPVSFDKDTKSEEKRQGYTVEKRFHKKNNKDIFAINFTERMGRDAFLTAKKQAKDAGGYYSSFGKGGFIFETEEQANTFAQNILALNSLRSNIEEARAEVELNPTEAQKESGNYKKGHIIIDGYNITLENPKGSERSGTDKDGNKWNVTMNNDYGYIRGTEGVDGDHIDVFLSDTPEDGNVYVVDQINEDGTFDEHKVMYGFDTREDAKEAYLANYSPGWTGLGQITEVSKDQFKKWIESSHRKTKPFAEYKSMLTPKQLTEVNGYRKGDAVYYGGQPAKIYDFEKDGRPILDTGLAPVMYEVGEWKDITPYVSKQPQQTKDTKKVKTEKKESGPQQISIEGLFADLYSKGEAKFKDNVTEESKAPAYGSQNKVVSTSRYEELKKQMRAKLNNLNVGYDPELIAIGAEMAAYHVEAGARKFADFAKRMLGDMGEGIRPYIKLFYNAARDFPGMESYEAEMTPYEEVKQTDINSIKLTEDEQTEANTEAVVSEAEAVTSEAETVAATGTTEEIEKKLNEIDSSLDKVNTQLALVGYYEADTSSPFHEVYGYAKSAEKKALADAKSFAKKLQKDLGVKNEKFSDKRRKLASANVAPAGGSITVNIPLQQDRVLAIYIPIDIDRATDDMYIPGGIMYRIESGSDFAGGSNMYISEKSDYPSMVKAFRRLAKMYLPEQQTDVPVTPPLREESEKVSETLSVGNLSTSENDVSLQDETIKQTENEQKRGSKTENPSLGTKVQQEDAEPVGNGMDRSSTGSAGTDQFGSGRSSVVSPINGTGSTIGKQNERNNRNERGIDYAPKSPKARFEANLRAIKLMRQLVSSEAVPTREQMEVLRKFSGWGGLGTFFNNEDSAEYKKLRELLTDEEFDAAAASINSAYYTPANIIDTLWDIAGKLGFKGGNILEGSAGIGNIIGSMPLSMAESSTIEAVEIDPITGNILKLLYPDAKVSIQGFEETRVRNGSVDLAITNVPFVTGLQVHDPIDKDLSRKFRNIHDFCIAKNVRKLREGGIGIFITSSGTMDKSTALREWLVNEGNADFIGAFRLNNKTFEGASVTSDIIVVRKRIGKTISPTTIDAVNSSIVRTGEYPTGESVWDKKLRSWVPETKKVTMELNNYFQQHPENMAGEMAFNYEKGETRYPGSYALFPVKGKNQNTMLSEWAESFQPVMEKDFQPQQIEEIETDTKNGALFADEKGNFYVSEMGVGVPLNLNANKVRGYEKAECLQDYNALKAALDAVLEYQVSNQDDTGLKPLLKKLNNTYDTFTDKYGYLNKNTSISFLRNDVDFPSIAAIEEYKEYKNAKEEKVVEVNKTNVFKGRVIGFQSEPQPKNVKDGVIASIYKFGHIDLGYIAEKLGKTSEDVKQTILNEGIGFVNPENSAVEVRYEYLSGNVRRKLEQAKENNQNGEYTENIKALEQVMPLDIPAHLVDFSLGSSWIDPQLYSDFIKDKFGVSEARLNHVEGIWNLKVSGERNEKNRSGGVFSEKFNEVIYGTELADAALNNKTIQVKKVITHSDKTKETLVDKEATQACLNRIQEIKDEFKEWMRNKMLQDEELATKVAKVYNEKFNNLVPKVIDEMFLPAHFGGSSEAITLYIHQKRAVIRGTTEPLLLAHEVGSGKTFTLISTAMEMRRLGTAKKPMIVVQNATVGQFVNDAKKLYPNAKILTITERDRTPEGRRAFYGRIKYSDWDLIIIPQSTFDMIPDSPERQLTFIQEKIDEKQHAIDVMQEIDGDENQIRQLENELVDLYAEYSQTSEKVREAKDEKQPKKRDRKREEKTKQNVAARAKEQLDRKVDEVQYFDEMGIDAILVDEAHEYKRLGFSTAMTRGVKGIDPAGSKKAAGVYLKTRAVLEQNGWKNVIFATGTPISNTAAEIWTFMRYLMPKSVMKENEIYYFDDFVRNFGSISQSLEFATSGKFKENTRFAAYINKPELIRLWSSVSDTVLTKDISYVNDKIPRLEKDTHQDIFLPQSDSLVSIMNAVRAQLEWFEGLTGKEKRENSHIPLTMYGIAKRAAIDTRLVDANAPDDPLSKTNKAVEETLKSLEETKDYKGTVAIFCDNQRRWDGNKVGFDLFEDMREKLISRGVPANQIIIMKPGISVAKKQKIFDEVNAGAVRVIIGNTQTLGTGVNIQERLHTLIHMDAPDRPMDYTQRNGRILRQGNMHKVWNKPVRILRFGVEDSLDVTSYQRLKTKAGFIDSIMDGKAALTNNQENRTLEEEEEGLFDNPVAILSGSQYALLKNQAEREYRKFLSKKAMYEADQIYVANRLAKNKQQLETIKGHIADNKQKFAKARELFPDGSVSVISIEGHKCKNQQEIEETLKEFVNKKVRALEDVARKDTYFRTQSLSFKLKFDDVDATAYVTLTREEDYDFTRKATRITIRRGVAYDIPAMGIKNATAPGGYVRNAIDDITQNVVTGKAFSDAVDLLTTSVSGMEAENELLEQRKGKPFEFSSELEAAKEKVDEYTELMKAELAEKEAKYAGRGTAADIDLSEIESEEEQTGDTVEEEVRFRTIEPEGTVYAAIDEIHTEARKLNLPVTVYTSIEQLPQGAARRTIEKGVRVKGWYQDGHIHIYLPNATGMEDVKATLLHEGVAHYGLRQMMGESNFNRFLDNVFTTASTEVRRKILELAPKYNYNMREATEEYLAAMAERGIDDPSLWQQIKQFFRNMLESLGYNWEITDNDLRYLLWESYNRLRNSSNPIDIARETGMRNKLQIGQFGEIGPRFRLDFEFEDRPEIIKKYDEKINSNSFRFQEAFQDSMLSLKVLQELIEAQSGKKIRSFENAYTAENRLSSINKVDNERYLEDFFSPLVEHVKKLSDQFGRSEVEKYIYAKSGLERNEVFLNRDAQKAFDESKKELDEKLEKGTITQVQYDTLIKGVDDTFNKTLAEGRDYSGLEGLVMKEYEDELNELVDTNMIDKKEALRRATEIKKGYKEFSEKVVESFESQVPQTEIEKLWQLINAATNETLNKRLESGLISAETYEDLKGMMKYYVPMQGWEETIAEDVYEYTGRKSPVQKEKKAKGRKSLADNPIATIALAAQNAIILGNRNKMKQRFFNFVINRPNELAVISDVWYGRTLTTVHGQVERIYPDINENDDAETIRKKLEDFEKQMKEKEAEGLAYRGKVPFGMELKTKAGQKPEHMVPVTINGRDYVIYINGDPRAAQALNGKTNPEGEENIFWEFYNKAKRYYGGGLTSNNPDFVAANLVRDSIHSATMEFMNGGFLASAKFIGNIFSSFNTVFRGVTGKYDANNKLDVYFQEFVKYGGETGYTAVHTLEDYKKEYEKMLRDIKGMKKTFSKGKESIQAIMKWLEAANRIAEDVNRFNAYKSSREAGKSIEESIDAAKNITVNFNKKGSLGKGRGAWAGLAWFMNKWILFFNPSIQGMYQLMNTAQKNSKRLATTLGTVFASGFIMPYLNSLLIGAFGGDGDDDYFNQTDYTRMNNWLFFTGNGYLKIPLPPFFREIYGLGDIAHRIVTGRMTPEKASVSTLRQIQSAIGFINLIPEGEPSIQEAVSGIMPDLIAPLMDVAFNRDFTGRDIAKDSEYTKYLPEYERIYKGVSPVYVEISRWLNEIGGDEARRNPYFGTFINPAYMEHLITAYTGGIGKTVSNVVGSMVDLATGDTDNIEFRTIPVINRFGAPVNDRTVTGAVNRVFSDYLERYEQARIAEKRYKQFVKDGRKEFVKELERMKKSGETEFIRYFNARMKLLRKKQERLKDNPKDKVLEKQIRELKSEMIMKSKELLK